MNSNPNARAMAATTTGPPRVMGREPMSAHSLLADVIRSPMTKTERSEHQMTRAAQSRCDSGVLGVRERIAESATVLSVYSHT